MDKEKKERKKKKKGNGQSKNYASLKKEIDCWLTQKTDDIDE